MNEVNINLQDAMNLSIDTESMDCLNSIKEFFTSYVDGFQFMPQYKCGNWNGKVCMIKGINNLPYGLLFDLVKEYKKNLKNKFKINISDEVKQVFKGPDIKPIYDLSLEPYFFQDDCIKASLKYTKGIIRSATASGKSLIISYIIKTLLENNDKTGVYQSIIIVPSKSLVEQFKNDMVEYGIPENIIGKVYTGFKEWDKEIVISTWQSLNNNVDKISNYGCIIVDECHSAKAHVLKELLSHSYNSNYRIGFTGTLHQSELDNWNTKSYLGPILREYSSGFLAEEGYIAKCNVHLVNINYGDQYNKGWSADYNEAKENIFNNEYRLNFIYNLVNILDHNVLLLVGLVEKEGKVLESYLNKLSMLVEGQKTVKFLSGKDNVKERELWRKKCMKNKNIALIATYGIFQQGINIPNLKYIIFASPYKSKIRVLQSIGRSLRKHTNKEEGSQIFDIVDDTKFFKSHGESRLRFYDSEGFNVIELNLNSNEGYNIKDIIKL